MDDFDAFYSALEERFRGSFETIKQRAAVYLQDLPSGTQLRALDLGCGRGEWLELMAENGIEAHGIDSNDKFAKAGMDRGLNISIGDIFSVVETLPSESFDVVTAFHVIEHLPLQRQLQLLREAKRLLRPDGLFIAEWPNILNFDVMRVGFWLDPTHVRPLPGDLLAFMAEYCGFGKVTLKTFRRSPLPVAPRRAGIRGSIDRLRAAVMGTNGAASSLPPILSAVHAGEDAAILARKAAA